MEIPVKGHHIETHWVSDVGCYSSARLRLSDGVDNQLYETPLSNAFQYGDSELQHIAKSVKTIVVDWSVNEIRDALIRKELPKDRSRNGLSPEYAPCNLSLWVCSLIDKTVARLAIILSLSLSGPTKLKCSACPSENDEENY